MPKPDLFPKTLPRGTSQYGIDCMAKVRAMLAEPARRPGPWWAIEVVNRASRGEPVTMTALEMARGALASARKQDQPERVPGEDDE
jgi:hypothetical protein